MTLQEIKDKKQTLESDILSLIRAFQKETSLNIADIKIVNEIIMGDKQSAIAWIEIDFKL